MDWWSGLRLGIPFHRGHVTNLQHSKPQFHWCGAPRLAQTAAKLLSALQEKSILNAVLAIVASAILKARSRGTATSPSFALCSSQFSFKVVVDQALDMLFHTPAVVLIQVYLILLCPMLLNTFWNWCTSKACWSPTHSVSGVLVHLPFPQKMKEAVR